MKITRFDAENVKRIKAVRLEPAESGLTIVGGNNNQGKTSVLDSIAWALGGEGFKPTKPAREGSAIPPSLHMVLDNGLVVERKGKNSALKVTDPNGGKGGQQLLNEFTEQLALNLPKFMEAPSKEKAQTLLQVIGVGDKVKELELKEKEKYNDRQAIGRIADKKKKFADEQTYYPEAPSELVSASDLIKEQQEILARNGRNQELRLQANDLDRKVKDLEKQIAEAFGKAAEWNQKANELKTEYNKLSEDRDTAFRTCDDLQDESTAELEASIANIEEINRKVRANLDKEKAEDDAKQYREQYDALTKEIDDIRQEKISLLNGANLPLPGLSVEDGELIYNGQKWDCMSGSEQLKVSTAIVRKLNPKCEFVLLDKLEQMDLDTLKEFGEWLEAEGLQCIATRVSTGDECSIYIEDGYSYAMDGTPTFAEEEAPKPEPKKWKKGAF